MMFQSHWLSLLLSQFQVLRRLTVLAWAWQTHLVAGSQGCEFTWAVMHWAG